MSQQPGILNGCRRQTLEQQWNCSGDTAALCSSTGLASGKICRYEYRRQRAAVITAAPASCRGLHPSAQWQRRHRRSVCAG